MDLSALGNTLPPGLADAEREMGDKFRASALSITNLYKSSLSYTKQAYQVGYSACLADVLSTVQSSIGAGQDASQTLSRLMDWAEARETAMAAFAAEEGDDTSLNTPAQPHPHRRAALTRHQLHLQATGTNRPSSAPIPESYYQHRTPNAHVASDSPGPSQSRLRMRGGLYENATVDGAMEHTRQSAVGGDPDQTFVQGSTPISLDATPANNLRPLASNEGGNPVIQSTPASSPTVAARPVHGGNSRISRSPLRYRHDTSSASSSTLPSLPFAPVLPTNLPHLPSQQALLSLPQMTSSSIPIGVGSKRPITAVHLDPDLDVAMTDDGMTGVGVGRGGRATKRRNMDKRGESRDARDGDSGGGDGSGKEREERRRGRKGKDIGG